MSEFEPWATIEELGEGYRSGRCGPVEATAAMLDRIGALNPKLHAYWSVDREGALAAAEIAAAELRDGLDRGPLQGVPIAVKDLCDVAGQETSAGTEVARGQVAATDSTVVQRLRAAGAVILGKLAMTEGAYIEHHPVRREQVGGIPVNAWAADRWSGVSSSGSGVATAAALCFGSLGSDTGGSIRYPSSANGVVGIKPTYGRVSRYGVFPMAASLDHVGPMARSVRDAALMLQAIAGSDPHDPTTLSAPVPDYLAEAELGCHAVRIGIDESWMARGLEPRIVEQVLAAAATLEKQGARLCPVALPDSTDLVFGWAVTCGTELALAHQAWFPEREAEYGEALRGLIGAAATWDACAYARVHEQRLKYSGALAAVFEHVDLLLCPGLAIETPEAEPLGLATDLELTEKIMRFTAPFNYSGSPSITLPCGMSPAGLPQGFQLIGPHQGEGLCIRAARAYERVGLSAASLRPPLAASEV